MMQGSILKVGTKTFQIDEIKPRADIWADITNVRFDEDKGTYDFDIKAWPLGVKPSDVESYRIPPWVGALPTKIVLKLKPEVFVSPVDLSEEEGGARGFMVNPDMLKENSR